MKLTPWKFEYTLHANCNGRITSSFLNLHILAAPGGDSFRAVTGPPSLCKCQNCSGLERKEKKHCIHCLAKPPYAGTFERVSRGYAGPHSEGFGK